jgi:bacteriocin biosynthesis cyclodehydratase domain-containing protein
VAGEATPLRFKASVEYFIDRTHALFLLSEGQHTWIPSPLYAGLAPLLDGVHSEDAIIEALVDIYPRDQILNALNNLRTRGYLAEDASTEDRPTRAFWEHVGVPPSVSRSRLSRARVSIVALGGLDSDVLQSLLRPHEVTVASHGELTVVVTDDYLRPELDAWHEESLKSAKSWLLVKPVGLETWIGPAFVPGQTGCWACLAHRLRLHRRLESYIAMRTGREAPVRAPCAFLPSTRTAALAEAATEIVRWVGTGTSSLLERVVSTNILTLERTSHLLTRRPQCPACGRPELAQSGVPRPVHLRERRKVHGLDGGHRALMPAEVLAQLDRHLSPITGIIGAIVPGERTAQTSSGELWLTPTFAAEHNFTDAQDEHFLLGDGLRRRSGGKGKTAEQARLSAVAEALERYCGLFEGTEPRIRRSFADLGTLAIHPNACMGYSKRQYADRHAHNRRGHKAYWVPEPFREDVEIEWTPLWSLTAERTCYVPTSLCYYGYRSTDPIFARADSNGCAAGSVLEEAVLQGILELVERDAVALWWYNRLQRPALDLDSVDDPYVPALKKHYRELRRDVWVLDVTSDFGIPTFAAISRRIDTTEEDIIYGFGAHLDPQVALIRSLTELNQSLEAVPAATAPNSTYRGGEDSIRWWKTVKVSEASYLMGDPAIGLRHLRDFKNLATDDLQQDVIMCMELARARGIEILVLEQSRPDVDLPVVRVVAPGLRHFWARFGPGRLYDVPVHEGWLARPLSESELNPFVIQF